MGSARCICVLARKPPQHAAQRRQIVRNDEAVAKPGVAVEAPVHQRVRA